MIGSASGVVIWLLRPDRRRSGRQSRRRRLQRQMCDVAGTAFAGRLGQRIETSQYPPRQCDVHPLDGVVQKCRVQRDDAEHPPRVIWFPAQGLKARRRGDGLAGVKRGIDPGGCRFLRAEDSLVHAVAGGEATGKVRHDDAERRGAGAGFDHDGIAHGLNCLLQAGLFADRGYQAGAEILLRVRHDDVAGAVGMLEDVMRAAHAVQDPSGGLEFPDQVCAFHRAHHTHRHASVNDTHWPETPAALRCGRTCCFGPAPGRDTVRRPDGRNDAAHGGADQAAGTTGSDRGAGCQRARPCGETRWRCRYRAARGEAHAGDV